MMERWEVHLEMRRTRPMMERWDVHLGMKRAQTMMMRWECESSPPIHLTPDLEHKLDLLHPMPDNQNHYAPMKSELFHDFTPTSSCTPMFIYHNSLLFSPIILLIFVALSSPTSSCTTLITSLTRQVPRANCKVCH